MRLSSLEYDDWIRHIFDHPAEGPQWYLAPDAPFWAGPPTLTLAHMTRLYETPITSLDAYSDAQINQGLWYLLSDAAGDVLANPALAAANRARCIAAINTLYHELFARRCTPHLSHRSEEAGPLNGVCYMWWDIQILLPQPGNREQTEVDRAALQVMEAALRVDSVACQESALHGLGHWYSGYPHEIGRIIDRYIARSTDARAELLVYARSARTGCVL